MNVKLWCDRVIRWGFYLLFVLVPLILTPWNFELFEYNKMMLTYALTALIVGAWIIKMIDAREFRIAKTPLDIPLALFVLSQFVSTLFSMDPHVSWFGYYSRFNGGMFSIISFVLLYYAFISNFTLIREARMLRVIVTSAAVVAIYAVLEHFGIDKNLWVQDVQSRVFSTLGQPNWLAAYMVALIPLAFALGITGQPIIWIATSVLFFIVTVWTRSRSGYAGLAVADIIFWGILFFKSKNFLKYRVPFFIAHAAFIIFVFVNGVYVEQIDSWVTLQGWRDRLVHKQVAPQKPRVTPSGTALELGGTESGTIRKYVWEAALNAWRGTTKNMIIGTGTETFAFAFYQYRPAGHNMTSEWDFLYNKAHNEYLNYLATTGIFGLGSYLVFLAAFIWWFMKHRHDNVLLLALFAGWVSILVTNFFGFSVVIMQIFLFLFPAIAVTLDRPEHGKNPERIVSLKLISSVAGYAQIAILLTVTALLLGLYRFWKADTNYALANRLGRAGQNTQAQTLDSQAIALNPGEPVYHDDLATVLASLSLSAAQDKNATLAAALAKQSLNESTAAITTSPQNVNFWKTRTKLYYTFSAFDPSLNAAAISSLERAEGLSPNDPKIYYNLAILYGREGNNDKAVQLLQKAKALKPDYRDAYFGLYVFYTELKETDKARAELQAYLTNVDPNDRDFQDRLKQ